MANAETPVAEAGNAGVESVLFSPTRIQDQDTKPSSAPTLDGAFSPPIAIHKVEPPTSEKPSEPVAKATPAAEPAAPPQATRNPETPPIPVGGLPTPPSPEPNQPARSSNLAVLKIEGFIRRQDAPAGFTPTPPAQPFDRNIVSEARLQVALNAQVAQMYKKPNLLEQMSNKPNHMPLAGVIIFVRAGQEGEEDRKKLVENLSKAIGKNVEDQVHNLPLGDKGHDALLKGLRAAVFDRSDKLFDRSSGLPDGDPEGEKLEKQAQKLRDEFDEQKLDEKVKSLPWEHGDRGKMIDELTSFTGLERKDVDTLVPRLIGNRLADPEKPSEVSNPQIGLLWMPTDFFSKEVVEKIEKRPDLFKKEPDERAPRADPGKVASTKPLALLEDEIRERDKLKNPEDYNADGTRKGALERGLNRILPYVPNTFTHTF